MGLLGKLGFGYACFMAVALDTLISCIINRILKSTQLTDILCYKQIVSLHIILKFLIYI